MRVLLVIVIIYLTLFNLAVYCNKTGNALSYGQWPRHGCFEYTRLDGLHDLHELHGQLPAGSSPSEEQSEAGSQPFGDFGSLIQSAALHPRLRRDSSTFRAQFRPSSHLAPPVAPPRNWSAFCRIAIRSRI